MVDRSSRPHYSPRRTPTCTERRIITSERGFRGHGLPMMRACVDTVHIEHLSAGTTVVMTSRTTPARVTSEPSLARALSDANAV
jgi:anti-sigma regulatory factor (Ser/Thr protein kinase)